MTGFLSPDHTNKHIGTVTHQLLQSIAQKSFEWWESINIKNQARLIQKQLTLLNHAQSTLENSVSIIQETIQQVLNDQTGRWILTQHQYNRCEYAITVMIDNTTSNFIIDRVFVDHDVLWIIDYKSSSPKPHQTLAEFLSDEKSKYQDQISHYVDALRLSWNLPIKAALYFPRIAAWSEY
jgi:ATP-dependent exoDNAse (exonuclease V) beta subunit